MENIGKETTIRAKDTAGELLTLSRISFVTVPTSANSLLFSHSVSSFPMMGNGCRVDSLLWSRISVRKLTKRSRFSPDLNRKQSICTVFAKGLDVGRKASHGLKQRLNLNASLVRMKSKVYAQ